MDDRRSLAAQSYLEAKVRDASPTELVSLLYEGLARRLHAAAAAIERQDLSEKGAAIGRCLDIVGHLRTSLDHAAGGELAINLERIYVYWTARLTEANVRSRREPLDELLGQLETLRSSWNEATREALPAQTTGALALAASGR